MFDKILKTTALALLIFFSFSSFYWPIEFEDGWWHLSAGRWIVEHRQVPHIDPFPFDHQGSPWILTQWLGSTVYYLSYAAGGYEGVKFFRAVLFLSIMLIFILYGYRRLPFPWLIIFAYIFLNALWGRFFLRPDTFNYVFIQLFMIHVLAYQRTFDSRHLWVLPLYGILWSNMHLGSFVFGGLLLGLCLFASVIASLNGFLKKQDRPFDPWKETQLFAVVLGSFLLAFAVSPYGIEALMYPFKVFLFPQHILFYKFLSTIDEAQPPVFLFSSWLSAIMFLALAGSGIMSIVLSKRGQLWKILLFIVSLFMYLCAKRAGIFFTIVILYLILDCVYERGIKEKWEALWFSKVVDKVALIVMILFLSCQLLMFLGGGMYIRGSWRDGASLNFYPRNPVASVQFLLDQHIIGNVFVQDLLGGYLLWTGYPKLRPFVDGRQINHRNFEECFNLLNKGASDVWEPLARQYNLNIVVWDTSVPASRDLAEYLAQAPNWQLVFVDGPTLVFVRRGIYKLPTLIDRLDGDIRSAALSEDDIGEIQWISKNVRTRSFQERLFDPEPKYIDVLEEGIVLFNLGFRGEGVRRILKAYETTGPNSLVRGTASAIVGILKYEEN